ncbi:MAG: four helix bundle protein [Chitinophagales bacterium]|nr:four helix bundle protein [Chitinophagales bacterium]
MSDKNDEKKFDLAQRTEGLLLTQDLIKNVKKTFENVEDLKQLIRSSGSDGANYLEAQENLSEKDFVFRVKVCRKEAKESAYWLRLFKDYVPVEMDVERIKLEDEAMQLTRIFRAIINRR